MKLIIFFLLCLLNTLIFSKDTIYINYDFYNIQDQTMQGSKESVETINKEILNLYPKNSNYKVSIHSKFKISSNFETLALIVFKNDSDIPFLTIINLDSNNNILGHTTLPTDCEIKDNNLNVTMPNLISINANSIFLFDKSTIRSYDINESGLITEKQSLEIQSPWQLSLIDDYFPNLKHLYLYIPFEISNYNSILSSVLNNLKLLESFSVFSEGNIYSHMFIKELSNNCQNLNLFTFDHLASDKDIIDLKNRCPNLNTFYVLLRRIHTQQFMNNSAYKYLSENQNESLNMVFDEIEF